MWLTPVISAVGKQRQENCSKAIGWWWCTPLSQQRQAELCELEASLVYTVSYKPTRSIWDLVSINQFISLLFVLLKFWTIYFVFRLYSTSYPNSFSTHPPVCTCVCALACVCMHACTYVCVWLSSSICAALRLLTVWMHWSVIDLAGSPPLKTKHKTWHYVFQ